MTGSGLRGFFEAAYADNRARRGGRRRLGRDLALYAGNLVCRPFERHHVARARGSEPRALFIVGAPRSGTTLLFQLLARHGDLTYIPNFAARYWMAPVVGLGRYRSRFDDGRREISLRSELGGTPGPHGPHEFSYFWHFWMGPAASDDRTAGELERVDWRSIREEIAALDHAFGRPVLFKSINFVDYHVDWFAELLPRALFLHIRRSPAFVAQSILESRIRRYGDASAWWSVRPRRYRDWSSLEPIEQVVRQIGDIEGALERSLERLPAERVVRLDYESLVAAPRVGLETILKPASAALIDPEELDGLELRAGNSRRLGEREWSRLESLLGAPA